MKVTFLWAGLLFYLLSLRQNTSLGKDRVRVRKCHFECLDMEPFPRLDCYTPMYEKDTKQVRNRPMETTEG